MRFSNLREILRLPQNQSDSISIDTEDQYEYR